MPEGSDAVIARAVRRVLEDAGPQHEADLLATLAAVGVDLGPVPEQRLADVLDAEGELVLPLSDGRWALLPSLLDGRVLTHRVTDLEARHDLVLVGVDVWPWTMLTEQEQFQRLTDGTPVLDVSPMLDRDVLAARGIPADDLGTEGALLLEPGRFAAAGVAAGDADAGRRRVVAVRGRRRPVPRAGRTAG